MGQIYCNNDNNPTHCFVVHKFGFCQEIFEIRDSAFFNNVIKKCIENKQQTKLRLYNPSVELYEYVSSLKYVKLAKRIHYYTDKETDIMDKDLFHCEIQIMDELAFEDTFQLDLMQRYYKNQQDFCKNAIPVIAKYEDKIIGIIYSAGNDSKRCEVDIFVDEKYRKKGVAQKLVHRFLNECKKRGIEVNWDCYENNVASNNLAIVCGFQKMKEYCFFNIE